MRPNNPYKGHLACLTQASSAESRPLTAYRASRLSRLLATRKNQNQKHNQWYSID